MSTITGSGVGSFSSGNTTSADEVLQQQQQELLNHFHGSDSLQEITVNGTSATQQQQPPPAKKKRNLPGTPGTVQTTSIFMINITSILFFRVLFSDLMVMLIEIDRFSFCIVHMLN